jgi:hypothetical protein
MMYRYLLNTDKKSFLREFLPFLVILYIDKISTSAGKSANRAAVLPSLRPRDSTRPDGSQVVGKCQVITPGEGAVSDQTRK